MNRIRPDASSLARDALDWMLATARDTGTGLAWTGRPDDDELDPTLYSGAAGIVPALLEGYRHFGDDRYADAALGGARTIAATGDDGWELSSLYFGLTGMAFALRSVHSLLGDREADEAAARALSRVRSRFDGERWADQFELLGGNAGIALGAARAGDLDLAVLAVTPYLRTAEPTAAGVHWETRVGQLARWHHIAHGTLGIVNALATVGRAARRSDMIELALAGAADVVSRNEAGPAGFLVAHSDPQHRPELIERHSYGRCCGTAGVLALACDRHVERGDDLRFADVLVDDLAARATVDVDGARWCNCEHRVEPSTLAPRTGWAMGNAGIVRELLRYVRIGDGRDPDYAVTWPDQPPTNRAERVTDDSRVQHGAASIS